MKNNKSLKIIISLIAVIAVIISSVCVYNYASKPVCETLNDREKMLQIRDGYEDFKIYSETELGEYIVASVYSPTSEGIAIFRPKNKGRHELQGVRYDFGKGHLIPEHLPNTKTGNYQLFLFNKPNLAYAEFTYIPDDGEPIKYKQPAETGKIVCFKLPDDWKGFTYKITFTDKDGKEYKYE